MQKYSSIESHWDYLEIFRLDTYLTVGLWNLALMEVIGVCF